MAQTQKQYKEKTSNLDLIKIRSVCIKNPTICRVITSAKKKDKEKIATQIIKVNFLNIGRILFF